MERACVASASCETRTRWSSTNATTADDGLETVGHPCVESITMAMTGYAASGRGAEWEQREVPNRLVRRPSAPNRLQRLPLSCDASCLGRSRAVANGR
jgi:hypothetical protein